MLATDFKLIPVSVLCTHEDTVMRRLDSLPFSYAKNLLEEPEIRYAFVYYALLTHWPESLDGIPVEELLYNRLYWFLRMSRQYEVDHDFEAGYERQTAALFEAATRELGDEVVRDVETKVLAELATNEREIAVAYSEFSIRKVKKQFGIKIDETSDFFADVPPLAVRPMLSEMLKESIPLALKINTEKARSELIVSFPARPASFPASIGKSMKCKVLAAAAIF